ncbi:putative deacetylase LmbE-like domain-containing protein [Pseudomassariella vexata]|uniref:N-acetylglucosaminylphosphatidylinositol deacetylase n=1 Tax=Pseudomassariella vexata TaxID=1141098 RepID=A0A1Y2EB55_9PEZI|nr:putative deacetylase LmbE-like domain-containing protein [Pseudomassariella vexata]ORY68534.1 putative deacetylase LmbE-like domain-containing protein [Pseudomassariella vexata]
MGSLQLPRGRKVGNVIAALVSIGFVVVFVISLLVLYNYATNYVRTHFPTLRNKRICLLIAHPDDEAMFFAPTLLALTPLETGNHVKILCLSSGNAAGLGETRKKELVKSALMLGLRHEDDVFVLDLPDFPDSMTTTWDADKIAALLASGLAPQLSQPNSSVIPRSPSSPTSTPTANIDVLVTFDATGVSSHPNHTSLYHGACRFIAALISPDGSCPIDLYTLTSLNAARKYSGFLDMFATIVGVKMSGKAEEKNKMGNPATLVSFSDLFEGRESMATARKAMTNAHLSQMVWFRWGWITLSRYMAINDLRLVRVKSKEQRSAK